MPVRKLQVSLEYGQLDANLIARQDSTPYHRGLARCENWEPIPQGGVRRRPKMEIESLAPTGANVRLIAWRYDEDEQYIISIGATEIRFHRRIVDTGVIDYLATQSMVAFWTSLTEEEIRQVQYAIYFDTVILCHPTFRPVIITRTGLESFDVGQFDWGKERFAASAVDVQQAPTYKFAHPEIKMQPVTVAGAAIPDGDIGDEIYFQWSGTNPITGNAYNPENIEVGSIIRYCGEPCEVLVEADVNDRVKVKCLTDLPLSKQIPVDLGENTESNTFIPYETVLCPETNGEGQIVNWGGTSPNEWIQVIVFRGNFDTTTKIIIGAESGTTVEINGATSAVNMLQSPTWAESAYSDYRGWPGAVEFFQQRLWFGGSWDLPQMVVASKINNYYNFDLGQGLDTDSIQAILSANQVGRIKAIKASRHLQFFTETSEHYTGENEFSPITPESVSFRVASRFGSGLATPTIFAGRVMFTDGTNRMLRASSWDDVAQQYNSPAIGYLHQDILTGIVDMVPAYGRDEQAAGQYCYILNDDGTIVVMFEIEAAEVRGMFLWTFNAVVNGICVLDNILFVNMGQYIYQVNIDEPSEKASILQTMPLVFDTQEGTTRGKYIRVGKLEVEGENISAMTINSREAYLPETPYTGQVEFYQLGWRQLPQETIEVDGDDTCTIFSINQEASY